MTSNFQQDSDPNHWRSCETEVDDWVVLSELPPLETLDAQDDAQDDALIIFQPTHNLIATHVHVIKIVDGSLIFEMNLILGPLHEIYT